MGYHGASTISPVHENKPLDSGSELASHAALRDFCWASPARYETPCRTISPKTGPRAPGGCNIARHLWPVRQGRMGDLLPWPPAGWFWWDKWWKNIDCSRNESHDFTDKVIEDKWERKQKLSACSIFYGIISAKRFKT